MQELAGQVGVVWIVMVFLAAAALIALTVVFLVSLIKMSHLTTKRLKGLTDSLDELPGCGIENLAPARALVAEQMNKEFQERFDRLADDSDAMFHSIWVPSPQERLTLPEILTLPAQLISHKSTGFAILLGGVAASTLALSSGFVLNGSLIDAPYLRFVALIPFVLAAIGMLVMHQASDIQMRQIQHVWQILMVTFERKLPVYSQEAQTARLVFQMQEYDAHMAKSVTALAMHVQSLSSGKLSDAVSNAVKYVMAATVAPAVVKSSEALGLLATQLDKQMQQADHKVAKLYVDLESRQQKQSELWLKRYQEIAEVLSYQQDTMLKSLTASEKQLVEELSKSQKFALEKIVEEQSKTLQHVNTVSQKAWSLLQEKLTSIISQLSDGQSKLLTGLSDQQQQTMSLISTTSEQTATTMRSQYDLILDQLRLTQSDLLQQVVSNQSSAYDKILTQQTESFNSVATSQQQAYQQVAQSQQEGLQLMRAQQAEAIHQMTDGQTTILQEIDQRQTKFLETISEQQATALQTINENQTSALRHITTTQTVSMGEFRQAQAESLSEMGKHQQEAVQYLAENFGSEVSSKLASYLDPISLRLHDASEALIKAQNYASDVKDVLKMQNEAATTLQSSIGDLFSQLLDTRKALAEDLASLKTSSNVMSKASEIMGSVFEGSQTGLSEAISQMSNDLLRLSDVLSAVMSGSAEQTRLMQTQSLEAYELNQKHLDAVRGQIVLLSDELSTRIDQLMLGFSNLTADLVNNVNTSINSQNDTLGSNLRSLTDVMSEEARSMSLFAQQINMDIDTLNANLRSAVSEFDNGMRSELTDVLGQFDAEVTDIVKRLARSATELGDAVESLPEAIRQAGQPGQSGPHPALGA